MKYIVTAIEDRTSEQYGLIQEDIFIFPNSIEHSAFAEAVRGIKNQSHGNWHRIFRTPIAAGFIDEKGNCSGESISLKLSSRPKDNELLKIKLDQYLSPDRCNEKMFNEGTVVAVLNCPTAILEVIIKEASKEGIEMDWFTVGGRDVIVTLGDVIQARENLKLKLPNVLRWG